MSKPSMRTFCELIGGHIWIVIDVDFIICYIYLMGPTLSIKNDLVDILGTSQLNGH
ncbi:hypothetical protein EGR_08251 [Echinococcus granulosus]|uniref:Transmembrane protein n=1 Tax=Echinococcus granulosus TaxID=6210 RepID=W6UU35_ECHGR|nr:hypothetical protein EGR_08251 [Echinococcus granulosus]EUB56899.1 hypothetical protein EGR_08251 [Echinococcus granulosus]